MWVVPAMPNHVEEIGREHVEAEAGQAVGVDLVIGGHPVRVVDHQDTRPRPGRVGMRQVAGDAVLLLRDHSRHDVHVRSFIETRQWIRSSSGG